MKLPRLRSCVFGCLLLFPRVPAAESPPTSAITIDGTHRLRAIPPTLFGTNLEWIWNCNLAWSGASIAPGFAPLIQEIAPTLLRFPGGLFADYYDWRNGVGPQSLRPISLSMPGGTYSANTCGTDEAQALAAQFKSELLITVNAGTGTAQMAADWVRHVNAGAGPRVKYWEIGNELYLPASNLNGVATASLTPAQYVETLISFSRAMKAVDPTIQIGAILDESFNTTKSSPWTVAVLTQAADFIDFVAVHDAYAPLLLQPTSQDVYHVYQAMLAAPTMIAAHLHSLAERIDALIPSRAGQIPIAVTEWGAFYHIDPQNPYIDHVKTLGSALYTASTLMTFIRSPRTTIANHFKLSDPLFMGMIGFRNGEPAATASWYAMEMLHKHAGPILLASSVASPVFAETGAGAVGPAANIPFLDAIATLSADGAHCYLTVVNRNLDAPVNAAIHLLGLKPEGSATVWTLAGTAIDANTGTAPPPGYLQAAPAQWARFSLGGPGEVTITSTSRSGLTEEFHFSFPAASVTSLDLALKKAEQ
jgi:alpha-N-arabinofuranosidase